jgi:predicted RNase H-like HicB family nuclease
MKIHVVVHQDQDGYWAEVPALPYIVVNAKNQIDLMEQVRQAIDLYFVSAIAEPPPTRVGESISLVELSM